VLIQNPLNEYASALPILECIHITGMLCGEGTALLVSLRLAGVGLPRSGTAQLWKATVPWTVGGILLSIFSGLLLFSIDPQPYFVNPVLRFKILALVLAVSFYFVAVRKAAGAGKGPGVGCISLGLWALVPLGAISIGFTGSLANAWSYGYPALLWLHIVALALLGGMVLATDLRLLGLGMWSYSISDVANGLRAPKRLAFLLASITGVALFAVKAQHAWHVYNRWFWIKLALLAFVAANYLALRRSVFAEAAPHRAKLAAGLSLVLGAGLVAAARGPATVKDIMHSIVDPSGDYLFQSVQTIADERGVREKAPATDEEWENVRQRVKVLEDVPDVMSAPGRWAAQPKDQSRNPEVENEPWEVQELLDTEHPEFVRRARRMQDAASMAMKAVEAKDPNALLLALEGIDKACESCHLHYWYPKDQRAQQAAKEDGVLE
jgi:hypothetical protein